MLDPTDLEAQSLADAVALIILLLLLNLKQTIAHGDKEKWSVELPLCRLLYSYANIVVEYRIRSEGHIRKQSHNDQNRKTCLESKLKARKL